MDTTRHMQDHDLTLFPAKQLQVFLGYSRNVETGPALTTIQLFNSQGDEYPLFAEYATAKTNEYRLGGEVQSARLPPERDAWLGGFQGGYSRNPHLRLRRAIIRTT